MGTGRTGRLYAGVNDPATLSQALRRSRLPMYPPLRDSYFVQSRSWCEAVKLLDGLISAAQV